MWRDEAPAAHIGAVVGLAPATYLEGVSSRAAELLAHITTGLQLERVLDAAGIHQLLPDASALREHNEGPIHPRGIASGETAMLTSQALSALATSHYGWNPRDVLARQWLGLGETP